MLEKAICNLIKFPLNFLLSRGNEFLFSHHRRVAAAKEILLSESFSVPRDDDKNANFHFTQSAAITNLICDEKAQLLTMKSSRRCCE